MSYDSSTAENATGSPVLPLEGDSERAALRVSEWQTPFDEQLPPEVRAPLDFECGFDTERSVPWSAIQQASVRFAEELWAGDVSVERGGEGWSISAALPHYGVASVRVVTHAKPLAVHVDLADADGGRFAKLPSLPEFARKLRRPCYGQGAR